MKEVEKTLIRELISSDKIDLAIDTLLKDDTKLGRRQRIQLYNLRRRYKALLQARRDGTIHSGETPESNLIVISLLELIEDIPSKRKGTFETSSFGFEGRERELEFLLKYIAKPLISGLLTWGIFYLILSSLLIGGLIGALVTIIILIFESR